jgi:DNA-directed RNA polymerase subunit RPC12/RpoP
VLCPRCGAPLKVGPRITRRDGAIQELVCEACRRCVMVKSRAD